ncbi:MAG: ATP-binding protein [Bacteroidetes bacterium]|nr:ATP-binding protein [Bacteroidota bacterium]
MSKNPSEPNNFIFKISLSVLDHLGRHLYRSFSTVLGEAISNSWDADAQSVRIYLDRETSNLTIVDDGIGMTPSQFQDHFLKIGYSKRKGNITRSPSGRPFIGRKGIGKLALLSCAKRVTIVTKTEETGWTGGVIDNAGLDSAITEDLTPQDYLLDKYDSGHISSYSSHLIHGTVIHFEGLNEAVKHTDEYLRKIIALSFRFSIIDSTFKIFYQDTEITFDDLEDLALGTQFIWNINTPEDPFALYIQSKFDEKSEVISLPAPVEVRGFLASVKKPRLLKVTGTDERVGVDLFVNGRVREKNILKHIPTARIPEDYLYGQIHFDSLDDGTDRFATGREGIVADDPIYSAFLNALLKHIVNPIVNQWDALRRKHKETGDPENKTITTKQRKLEELVNEVSDEYVKELTTGSKEKQKVRDWIDELSEDAQFNIGAYTDCFVSENLVRKYIDDSAISTDSMKEQIKEYRRQSVEHKEKANISFVIRENDSDLSYLSMDQLTFLADAKGKDKIKDAYLHRHATEYKPLRDAMAHTARLTPESKTRLQSVYDNIKGRIIKLLTESE